MKFNLKPLFITIGILFGLLIITSTFKSCSYNSGKMRIDITVVDVMETNKGNYVFEFSANGTKNLIEEISSDDTEQINKYINAYNKDKTIKQYIPKAKYYEDYGYKHKGVDVFTADELEKYKVNEIYSAIALIFWICAVLFFVGSMILLD